MLWDEKASVVKGGDRMVTFNKYVSTVKELARDQHWRNIRMPRDVKPILDASILRRQLLRWLEIKSKRNRFKRQPFVIRSQV